MTRNMQYLINRNVACVNSLACSPDTLCACGLDMVQIYNLYVHVW